MNTEIRTWLPKRLGGLYGINVEVLAGNKTLTPNVDKIYQYLDTNGANRLVTLRTTEATTGDRFVIKNTGIYSAAFALLIRTEITGVTNIEYIYTQNIKSFIFNGTKWVSVDVATGDDVADSNKNMAVGYLARPTNLGVAIGRQTRAYDLGLAVGNECYGYDHGTGVGYTALGHTWGVALGYLAYGFNYGTALGAQTNTQNKLFSIALGYYSICQRVAETTINIGMTPNTFLYVQGRYGETTVNAAPVEMGLGAGATRFTIIAQSALAFRITVVARDNTANDVAMYTFEGVIKRDAANNTVLSVCNKTIVYEGDAAWDCAVTADDANEALIITVTGDAANPVQWAAVLEGVETRFV